MRGPAPAVATDSARAESGEQRLLAAVLRLALEDASHGRRDALLWIASDGASCRVTGRWSYLDVAEALGLDPTWARAQVAQRCRPPRRRGGLRSVRLHAA